MPALRNIWVRFAAVLLLILIVLFAPYKSVVSPHWLIQVVEVEGTPVSDFPVILNWSYFGIDFAPMLENGRTDSQGRVEFQKKAKWASLAERVLNFQNSARPGPAVWIEACDDHSLMGESFWDGNRFALGPSSPQHIRIIVKPSRHCVFT
ncbi:MAG TPA: hypothetical protein VJN93_09560 [Candidatus Acidoferrum sp.]|nr:hypothetical protein [Candidatus Acidoferrum sp.]